MNKVSLRKYNREIENLIDQGYINEAIAHCRHILKSFSKHLATYRLLGKAYLELKRYAEAIDVFSRVLMAVPDDFVSHVGMSIIRDEENKLDDAIWHMERAFESQPSNAAIQGELQRLFGRRDGVEPPKIRMTRGALAHMYVQHELYPQAIAEIRAVLAEKADRTDMQVLLARAYFRNGQKADASDMCTQLLKRYQYCFDANRIMVDLLPTTAGVAESMQVYRVRVGEMDPYAIFAKGSVFLSHEVADAAINLERLEYKGDEETSGQAWNLTLGLGKGIYVAPASQSTLHTEIPDFLRQAGWGESSASERTTSFFDEEPAGGELSPADLPDWLMDNQPSESAQVGNVPDWLSGLDNTQAAELVQESNVPDWQKGVMPKSRTNTDKQSRSLQVFLCHSTSDKPTVRKLYLQLSKETWIDPWLDEEKLDPGDRWNFEIRRAVKNSDIVIVCISISSINKEGFIQKEIKFALDVADEKPEDTIFIIPLKLEECTVPDRLSDWQWVNYYQQGAYERLMRSLRKRARALGVNIE